MNPWQFRALGVFRIVLALMFMQHGAQKLLAYPVSEPREPVALLSVMGLAGVLELIGGGFVALGLFTRPVAFILSGQMAVAYFWRHAPAAFWPVLNRGELAVLYCFAFLYLAFAGPGIASLDARLRGKRRAALR